jgi:hypothetical protein
MRIVVINILSNNKTNSIEGASLSLVSVYKDNKMIVKLYYSDISWIIAIFFNIIVFFVCICV